MFLKKYIIGYNITIAGADSIRLQFNIKLLGQSEFLTLCF